MIPIATTRVTLLQPGGGSTSDDTDDWGGAPDPETGYSPAATGVRAHLSAPSALATHQGEGSTVVTEFRMLTDPCALADNMRVRDETTGLEYDVAWVLPRPALISHVVAGLTRSVGTS